MPLGHDAWADGVCRMRIVTNHPHHPLSWPSSVDVAAEGVWCGMAGQLNDDKVKVPFLLLMVVAWESGLHLDGSQAVSWLIWIAERLK